MRLILIVVALAWGLWVQPVQAQIKIENIEPSLGLVGPARQGDAYYPYEDIFFRYQIVGVQVDDDGRADTTLKLVLKDPSGKTLLDQDSVTEGTLALGGGIMPGSAYVTLTDEVPPGEYTLTVTVKDKLARHEGSFSRTFKLLAPKFAILSPRFYYDREGQIPAPVGGLVGQTLFLEVKAIGFDRSQGRIDSEMNIELLDAKGRNLMPKPVRADLKTDDENLVQKAPYLNFRANLALNRAGDFKLRITIADNVGQQTATFEVPLKAAAP